MFSRVLKGGTGVFAALALTMPLSAFAGSSAAAVTVSQSQSAWSPNRQVDLQQSAVAEVSTSLENQASAWSKSAGNQSLWVTGKESQSQELTAGAGLTWENSWPGNAVAKTTGSVDQTQVAWSDRPIMAKQDAGVWQKSRVGSNDSRVDTSVWQTNLGGVGDVSNDQSVSGLTRSEGFVDPPAPFCSWWCGPSWWSNVGGQLRTVVHVVVENVFTF